jgi:tRNA (guanine37-N1)-methyltransferase
MSPKGKTFTQERAIELSKYEHIVLLCGHYEGVDQRVIDEIVDEEISIGDFVLTGGELPALVVADAVCRMLPGVLADEICFTEESHFQGLLEFPQYTKPDCWLDRKVPDVLLSGHHANIAKWRREKAIEETYKRRPDMLSKAVLSKKEKQFLESIKSKDICNT